MRLKLSVLARIFAVGIAPVALLGAAVAPAHAASSSFTIKTAQDGSPYIGSFGRGAHVTIPAAIRVFGSPSSRKFNGKRAACQVDWHRLRLRIYFVNYGGGNACQDGAVSSFVARGSRFRTWEGLRPGMDSSEVPERHSSAAFRNGRWVLRSHYIGACCGTVESVVARVQSGRVRTIEGIIAAGGE